MRYASFLRFAALCLLALWFSGTAAGEPAKGGAMTNERATPAKEPELRTLDDLREEIKALRQRIATLEALKPTFTNFMPDFAERFHVMHHAGEAGDWAVAAHEVAEMRRLMRISTHIDGKLGKLMHAFLDGNLRNLRQAIDHENDKAFQEALKNTVESCNGCHEAAGSAIVVSLDVDESLSMRHPHALRNSTAPKGHTHGH